MRYSYSRVSCFDICPRQYKYRYLDKLKALPDYDSNSPLILGTCLHHAIEGDIEEAINEYYQNFPIIDDTHVNEAMKVANLSQKVKSILPNNVEFEVELKDDNFIGYIDLLVKVGDNEYDIYDFKYTNSIDRYMESAQLHVYKYYFEKLNPTKKIRKLGFIFIPKTLIRQGRRENLFEFRKRLNNQLDKMKPKVVEFEYNPKKVEWYFDLIKKINKTKNFPPIESGICRFCDYEPYCKRGEDWFLERCD